MSSISTQTAAVGNKTEGSNTIMSTSFALKFWSNKVIDKMCFRVGENSQQGVPRGKQLTWSGIFAFLSENYQKILW